MMTTEPPRSYRAAIGPHAGHKVTTTGPDWKLTKSCTLMRCECGDEWAVPNAMLDGHLTDRHVLYGMARSYWR